MPYNILLRFAYDRKNERFFNFVQLQRWRHLGVVELTTQVSLRFFFKANIVVIAVVITTPTPLKTFCENGNLPEMGF